VLAGFANLFVAATEWTASEWVAILALVPSAGAFRAFEIASAVVQAGALWTAAYFLGARRSWAPLFAVVALLGAALLALAVSIGTDQLLAQVVQATGRSLDTASAEMNQNIQSLLRQWLLTLIWCSYFFVSKRVANTYGPVSWRRIRDWLLRRSVDRASGGERTRLLARDGEDHGVGDAGAVPNWTWYEGPPPPADSHTSTQAAPPAEPASTPRAERRRAPRTEPPPSRGDQPSWPTRFATARARVTPRALGIVASCAIVLFLLATVWPTRYRYLDVRYGAATRTLRIDRLTNETAVWNPTDGWRPIP
jgi:hypothetical protein